MTPVKEARAVGNKIYCFFTYNMDLYLFHHAGVVLSEGGVVVCMLPKYMCIYSMYMCMHFNLISQNMLIFTCIFM